MRNMVLIDANVLLEVLLPGRLQKTRVAEWLSVNKQTGCISILTVYLTLYFGLKAGIVESKIHEFLSDYLIQDLVVADYLQAKRLVKNKDYEDALQLATAIRTGCGAVVTLDKKFAQNYKDIFNFIVL